MMDEKIDEFVRSVLLTSEKGAHSYDHTKRVYLLAMAIGSKAGADLKVLGAAAQLHDVGRPREAQTGESHSVISGEMGRPIMREVGYTEHEIELVVQAIRTHRFSEGLAPTSIEGEVLSDADKLDAMGAIGVFRAIAQASMTGVGIDGFLIHADEKLLNLHKLMYTEQAKTLAEKRHVILDRFVNQLREEIQSSVEN
jgi:uncharacterized protein